MARALHARTSGAVILLYHRVARLDSDPYAVSIDPERFAEHLDVIQRFTSPLHLSDLARRLRKGRLPARAVCVTFDDGYVDNLDTARPLLERYDVPATVFTTTGRMGRDREFWWDELARVILDTVDLPRRLSVPVSGRTLELDLGHPEEYVEARERIRGWHLGKKDPSPRHAAFRQLYHALQRGGPQDQASVLDRLAEWSGVRPTVRLTHRALEPDDIRDLAGGPIEIGSHTVNHPNLSVRSIESQREEIRASRRMLQEWLGREVSAFAYPYGFYTPESVEEVKRAGYSLACICGGRVVRRWSPSLELPRVDAPNVDGDELAHRLAGLFGRTVGSVRPRPRWS